jgi:hypothetical protein
MAAASAGDLDLSSGVEDCLHPLGFMNLGLESW